MVNITPFLETHLKLRLHIIEIVLIVIALILTGVYISMIPFITRSEIMIIPFSIKSLIIIAYQLLTQHTARYSKWASLKANMILNFIEPVFWFVVIILKFMGISRTCTGGSCGVNVVLTLVAIAILILTIQVAAISFLDRRHFKQYGVPRGTPAGFAQEQQQPSAYSYGNGHK
ncbi:hypothetical protein ACHAQA_009041 [Verticillium albo-atrum]